jgi:hypothetical protein
MHRANAGGCQRQQLCCSCRAFRLSLLYPVLCIAGLCALLVCVHCLSAAVVYDSVRHDSLRGVLLALKCSYLWLLSDGCFLAGDCVVCESWRAVMIFYTLRCFNGSIAVPTMKRYRMHERLASEPSTPTCVRLLWCLVSLGVACVLAAHACIY